MGNSIFLAKVIGPYCIIVALSFLLNRQNYQQVCDDILNNAGVKLFGGFIGLLVGLLIVNTHNVWEANWRVIITLVGWSGLIKGTCFFLIPDGFAKFARNYQKKEKLVRFQLGLTLLFGLVLTYKGYF